MAKGRIRSRMELREQYEAAEARERESRQKGDAAGDEEDLGDLTGEVETEAEAEVAPVKKKKVKKVTEPKPRKKATKTVRKRVVWVVYDNSMKKVAQYDYPKKDEAEAHAERLRTEKKQTYFIQPVKEEIAETPA